MKSKGESYSPNHNVIDLCSFRRSHASTAPFPPNHNLIFYLSDTGQWLELLQSFKHIVVEDIRSAEALSRKLEGETPSLVILESSCQWACPLATIDRLEYLLEVPIVLICDSRQKKRRAELVKKAFAAGVHDTLFTPLQHDELSEMFGVLLKLQRPSAT